MSEFRAMGHYRLASKKLGDDITLSRYVRLKSPPNKGRARNVSLPGMELGFVKEARTKFPTRVLQPEALSNILVSGHSNVKIGRDVRRGRFKGYWIYTLSLQERATCPSTCHHWQDCYGNNMVFGKRVDHTSPHFLPLLEREIEKLLAMRGRAGVLIRLHVLGDFYSTEYVDFWARMMAKHPRLAVFGYTARTKGAIAYMLREVADTFGDRWMVRWSDAGYREMCTVSIASEAAPVPAGSFVCPEQLEIVDKATKRVKMCATCGACWATKKNVAFIGH